MAANTVVRARIDEKTKKQAEKVFKRMGLTTSSAFRMFLIRTVAEKTLPFNPQPNKETIEAMRELKKGGGKTYASVDQLMSALNADD
ncbi:MAG: type II toxin-antitoxin system RelB/DinJ family antitoxin [Edaphobacter sp.]